ncbi:MAG: hypothetical protein OXE56_11130 [Gammaproteobacteria bacterium]|nr:hypothetical protein [Gammaproteobacteria bacterium]
MYNSRLQSNTSDINLSEQFQNLGWLHFKFDPALLKWVDHVLPYARAAVAAPENAEWLRCGGTWFVGVNLLPNNLQGRVDDSDPISGEAISFLKNNHAFTGFNLDKAQISVCYPGYPKPSETEFGSTYRYRRNRDGAHIDGLLAIGADRRRYLKEPHAYILGIPMTDFNADAAPPVVWESSHNIVRAVFREFFSDIQEELWANVDITNTYHHLRKEVFDKCQRIQLKLKRGESFLVHRLALHGIGPWGETARAGPDGRMICYFRPKFKSPSEWLCAP